ncbi:CopM family metallochaperone [Aquibaculum arenosum]|uniref:DUF305 domain-containing protein n=1 Tax=Aquibaculum arenosum TaxID=3032591 RepID=A0ABT5YK76_9PROT|nr:DUF305 domain-containing protein [Fodinicurvata sp. CAU 1616]MDF2095329.1 DUF305 domain-containing protein [Fodinicurvata sp. CAU 1616]
MNALKPFLLAAMATGGLTVSATAQDLHFQLPEVCSSSLPVSDGHDGHGSHDGHDHGGEQHDPGTSSTAMSAHDSESLPEHVRENMRRMDITVPAMHAGMMIEDADIAFACAMIPHHQGAIDMAEVLLEHGEDPQMRALAEEIIETQADEIEQMKKWLEAQTN